MEMPITIISRRAMGTRFEIHLAGRAPDYLANAAAEALDEVERLEQQMSLYNPVSELNWINARAAREAVIVEPGLFALLQLAQRVWQDTEGAFDITTAPLSRAWGFIGGRPAVPAPQALEAARALVGMFHVKLDAARRTVRFDREGVQLDLGGIAKGWAVDRAIEILVDKEVPAALVSGGHSTIKGIGSPQGAEGWPVALRYPPVTGEVLETVHLRGRALSTSAAYGKQFEVEGVTYGHILDPRSGWPARGLLSASALGESAAEADALSTAFFVLGVEGTRGYCRKHAGVAALLVPEPAPGARAGIVRICGEN